MTSASFLASGMVCLLACTAGAQRPRVHEVPLQRTPSHKVPTRRAPAREVPLQREAAPAPVVAAPPVADDSSADLYATVITFSPGEEVWERFGHNALWIHDGRAGTDIAYNWGNFDFAQPHFLQRFLSGDTRYWMEGVDAYRMIAAYHEIGRRITLQRLVLTPAQTTALRDFLRWNAREENKYYRYDYFRDNCSTGLRDAIDRALDGSLRRATDTVRTDLTYRGESVRLTSGLFPVELGIDVALGRPADQRLTEWQSFFIPMRLRDALQTLTVAAADGTPVALVSDQRTIPPTSGPVVVTPDEPPNLVPRLLALGLLLAAVAVVLRVLGRSSRIALWGLALFGMLWSLLCGALGLLLIYMWAFTRHVFWGWNENLLLLSPLSLVLLICLPAALLRARAVRPARSTSRIIVVLGMIAFGLAVFPGGQQSLAIVALVLPVHLALAWALERPVPIPPRRDDTP